MTGTRTHEAGHVDARGPGADDADARSAEYMARFGLAGGAARSTRLTAGLNRIAARIAPYADPFAAQVLSDLAVWVFAFDDLCDEDLDAVGAALPAPLWEDRRIRALTEMAAGIVVIDTDIHSFAKENERGSRSGNVVALLEAPHRPRPGQGLHAASALRDTIMRRFTHLGQQTAGASADPRVPRFLDALTQYVHGVRDWCGATSRYHPGQPVDTRHRPRRAGTAVRPAEDTFLTPPPIASIAWWWAVDGAPPPAP